ncbi:MAG: pilus assembly protein N-terminal domain-containing protein [Bryobacterales bacterium]|nr:pilus assembly protein N-terminal domain-containing protein [Bryobacterales bacterium]
MKAFFILAGWAALAAAAEFPETVLAVGRGTVIECGEGIARVSTSSPDVADVAMASGTEVLVQGKAIGQATVILWPKTGPRRLYPILVEPNIEPVRRLLREAFPGEQIDVRATKDSMVLVGRVSSPVAAEKALALAVTAFKGTVSNLDVSPAPQDRQILLRVKFAELNKTASSEFALNLVSTGALNTPGAVTTGQYPVPRPSRIGGGAPAEFSLSDVLNIFAFRPDLDVGVLIKALRSKGLLQILAEPNLVTTSGKDASFLAGGEFPVPVVQGGANAGAITVQFRQFGIQLSFQPQLTFRGTIRLHVKPEVSSLDPANGVVVSGFNIPALSTRRVETDIELNPGQSFAIAGLIDDRVTQNLAHIPGLASIPLLGELFKSHNFRKSKTELVVVVTPELVRGDSPIALPNMPEPFFDESTGKPPPQRPKEKGPKENK